MQTRYCTALIFCLTLVSGCAHWDTPATGLQLPAPRMRADAIVCEIGFLKWNSQSLGDDADLWSRIDEQIIPAETRQRLVDNGLRVGLFSGPLPEQIRKELQATGDPIAALTAPELAPGTEMLSRRETRQCREGVAEVLEIVPERNEISTVLLNEDGLIRCQRFEKPRAFFEMNTSHQGTGLVQFSLIPGIEHGPWRQRIIGNQGALRFDHRRDRQMFDFLTIDAELSPGKVLAITSTPESKGLGALLFGSRFASDSERLYLLVRFSNVQQDELFTTHNQDEQLVSPQE